MDLLSANILVYVTDKKHDFKIMSWTFIHDWKVYFFSMDCYYINVKVNYNSVFAQISILIKITKYQAGFTFQSAHSVWRRSIQSMRE